MTLRCLLFGHRRSRSRATFDEKRQVWVSECKRCITPLERGEDGAWQPADPLPADVKLEPVDRRASMPPLGGAAETPLGSSPARDSTEGGAAALGQGREQPLELSAS